MEAKHGPARPGRGPLVVASTLSLVVGLVQLRMAPQHFAEGWAPGSFFLAAALGLSLYGSVLLLWPTRGVLLAGMTSASVLVLVHLSSRPAGAAGPLDVLIAASGALLVGALGWMLAARRPRGRRMVGLVPALGAAFVLLHQPHALLLLARLIPG